MSGRTGNGQWWTSRRGGDYHDNVEEDGPHPTPLVMVTRELVARFTFHWHPIHIRGLLVGCGQHKRTTKTTTMPTTSDGPPNDEMSANYGLMLPFFLAIKLKTLIKKSVWCLCAFISVIMVVLWYGMVQAWVAHFVTPLKHR